jgi:hypothetical protein
MENPEPVSDGVLATYRYLRLGMVVLVVFFAASIIFARLSATCLQSKISDYYFTTAHPVFIGAICALAACLIVYQGSSNTEDALLNFSGFLAFVVALVPTARPRLCGPGLPEGYQAAVEDNVKALLVAAGLALVIYLPTKARSMRRHPTPAATPLPRVIPWLLAALLLAGVAYFVGYPDQFQQHAHNWAVVAMFSSIILVVLINAFQAWHRTDHTRTTKLWVTIAYSVIAGLMFITLVAAIFVYSAYGPDWQHWGVIALESVLILLFVAFWAAQTVDLWNVSDCRRVLPATPKIR